MPVQTKTSNFLRALLIVFLFSSLGFFDSPLLGQTPDSRLQTTGAAQAQEIETSAAQVKVKEPSFDSSTHLAQKKTPSKKKSSDPELDNPITSNSVPEIIGKVIRFSLGVIGSLALLMFIVGGVMWMTAGGNPDRVKKGRDILVWSTIGLLVIFTAFTILNFVLSAFK